MSVCWKRTQLATCIGASFLVTMPAFAQAQETSSGQIGDIVVTAQRRAESAQDVPISLQSFSADALQKAAVRSTEDLSAVVGGLIIQPTAARPAIFVRGVGTNSTATTPAVLTFVDGVYYPFGQSTDLANIASIEVLKGPQGTLFGRNATGGVMQITTRPPSETMGARVELGYGNYDTVEASSYITGGVAKGVAMDLALNYRDQGSGFGTNVFNGDDVAYTDKFSARSRLRLELSEATTLTLVGDYSKIRGTIGTNVSPAVGYGTLFILGQIRRQGTGEFFPGDFDINAGPVTPYYKASEWGMAGTLETEFSGVSLRSITSYRESKEVFFVDYDGSPANIINLANRNVPRTSFTQELQLLSNSSGPFEWVAGAFYYRGRSDRNPFSLDVINVAVWSKDIDESLAPYVQGSLEILPGTKLTLGGRYTWETRSSEGKVFDFDDGEEISGRSGRLQQKFREFTWRAALDQKLGRDALVYASVSRGFNAGFYNPTSIDGYANETQNPPVLPEFLTAYEIGAKTDFLDRRLRVNVSAFLYDYSNLQQQIYDSTSGTVNTINAASAEIKGVDFELVAKPISSLTLSVSGTYLDTKYKSYPLAPNYVLQADGSIVADGNIDAAGKQITNAPSWSYTVSASYVLKTSIGEFTTSANLNYRGKAYVDPGNRFPLPTRYVLDATERWTSNDGRLFASVWIKNLLDKRYDYAINILTPIGLIGQTAPPRTYGMSVGFQF